MLSWRKTGPSMQMNFGPNWQCPHEPTAQCMFPFQRQIKAIVGDAVLGELAKHKPHHQFRPARHADGSGRIDIEFRQQRCDQAYSTLPTSL